MLSTPLPLPEASKSVSAEHPPKRQAAALTLILALLLPTFGGANAAAQTPAPTQSPAAPAPTQPNPTAAPQPAVPSQSPFAEVTEEALRQRLVGKPLFLRGGYLGDSLSFTEHGDPIGHPAKSSYTLAGVQIEKVRLTKHKVEFIGARYALHFLGAMPYEDPSSAVDRVKITPKKKALKITIDREQVAKPKKQKESSKQKSQKPAPAAKTPATATGAVASSETDSAAPKAPTSTEAAKESQDDFAQESDKDSEKPSEQAADPASVTTTLSPAHAAAQLREALDKVFASGLDEKLRAQMPEFWQLYYKAQAASTDYRPKDPSVLRSSAVDQQAKLTSSIAPGSNEFAQANGIAGRALYRAVIGSDGTVGEIAVLRPIGFGLDENAVEAIRKASFQPAMKAGQPVAESLDLAVVFRIYSNRTSVAGADSQSGEAPKPAEPIKPGPYSVKPPQPQPQPESQPQPQPQP